MKLYLVTLSDAHQILARIAFPFPHSVRTGAAFAHRENDDRARIPARMQSEARRVRCYVPCVTASRTTNIGCHDPSHSDSYRHPCG
jgi:hypothetical protein